MKQNAELRALRTASDYFRGQKQTCYQKLFISIKFTKGGGGNEGIFCLHTIMYIVVYLYSSM